MGAVLSIPLMGASALTTSLALCIGAALCSALCGMASGTLRSSFLTRLVYAFMLLLNSLLSWIALLPYIVHKIENASFGYINIGCGEGSGCVSFSSVHRLNFALGSLHLVLAALLIGVKTPSDPRAIIQNGCWRFKMLAYLVFVLVNFFVIPDTFFVFYGNHIAIAFSTIFLGIGLILLVDFAHAWAERCLEKIEMEDLTGEGDASLYKKLLVGGTLAMYASSIIITVVMYWFFASSGCSMNQAAITINLVLTFIISAMLVNPVIQEHNPQAGLAQSSMVVFYCTYLVLSAVSAEPDDKLCNPLVRSRGTRTASIVLGAIFTFVAVAYTTFRAAANLAFSSGHDDDDAEFVAPSISAEPPARSDMRYEALKQAVEEGALPESALQEASLYDAPVPTPALTSYNYALFHVIFFLATQYVASLLTVNVTADDVGDFVPVGRTYFSSWVKIISSWICFVLYGWTLVAPVVMPDRFGVSL